MPPGVGNLYTPPEVGTQHTPAGSEVLISAIAHSIKVALNATAVNTRSSVAPCTGQAACIHPHRLTTVHWTRPADTRARVV